MFGEEIGRIIKLMKKIAKHIGEEEIWQLKSDKSINVIFVAMK